MAEPPPPVPACPTEAFGSAAPGEVGVKSREHQGSSNLPGTRCRGWRFRRRASDAGHRDAAIGPDVYSPSDHTGNDDHRRHCHLHANTSEARSGLPAHYQKARLRASRYIPQNRAGAGWNTGSA